MSKITYLNSHLHKFRKEPEYKCDLEDVEALAYYDVLVKEDKKTTKIFMKCFNNKETYLLMQVLKPCLGEFLMHLELNLVS